MTWFTGTSTGDRYTVGQAYSNGNGTYVAQSDGTFRNVNSGRTEVGSSQDPRTVWGGSSIVSSGGGDRSGGGSGAGSSSVESGGRSAVTTGPGSGYSVAGGRGDVPYRGAGAGSALSINLGSKDYAKTTPMVIGGVEYGRDTGWSDAQTAEDRWGEGEMLSPTFFYQWGVFLADTAQGIGTWTRKSMKEVVIPQANYASPKGARTPQEWNTEQKLLEMMR